MRTLRLTNGDLSLGTSNDYATVTDAPKVEQDVRNALVEPLGNDRFHPGWGSVLQDFIGLEADEFHRVQVVSEVNRVVGNYAAVQRDKVTSDVLSGVASRYTTDEILAAVTEVRVVAALDRFSVKITVGTVSGSSFTVEEVVA